MLILFSLIRMKIITSTSFSLKNNKFYATKSSTGSRNTSKVAEIVYPNATDSLDQLFMDMKISQNLCIMKIITLGLYELKFNV